MPKAAQRRLHLYLQAAERFSSQCALEENPYIRRDSMKFKGPRALKDIRLTVFWHRMEHGANSQKKWYQSSLLWSVRLVWTKHDLPLSPALPRIVRSSPSHICSFSQKYSMLLCNFSQRKTVLVHLTHYWFRTVEGGQLLWLPLSR